MTIERPIVEGLGSVDGVLEKGKRQDRLESVRTLGLNPSIRDRPCHAQPAS